MTPVNMDLSDCGTVMCEYKLLEGHGWSVDQMHKKMREKGYSFLIDDVFDAFYSLSKMFPTVSDYYQIEDKMIIYYEIDNTKPLYGMYLNENKNYSKDLEESFVKVTNQTGRVINGKVYYDANLYYKLWYEIVHLNKV